MILFTASSLAPTLFAQADHSAEASAEAYPIDLPTALRLAGAQNLDVELARQRLDEAKANYDGAVLQFFPWLSPGLAYRRHDDQIQNVEGRIIDVSKQSYAPGATLGVQIELGEAIYRRLAAKQVVYAADQALESQRQETALGAAQGYFDLAFAQTAVAVAQEALTIATNYYAQVEHAVGAGLAFRGDQMRVKVQVERNQSALHVAVEQRRLAAARLALTLNLDPAIALVAMDRLLPLQFADTGAALSSLVQQALSLRPEIKQTQALSAGALEAKRGVVYGPLIPTLGAQAFVGGLGGGFGGSFGNLGPQEDYFVGVNWRIGPGGLFDPSRRRAAEARYQTARTSEEKIADEITRQVVEAYARVHSVNAQLASNQRALAAAEEGLRLAIERRQFAVGVVLETIQAEQDLTRARNDYFKAISEFNKAQYALRKAAGKLRNPAVRTPW